MSMSNHSPSFNGQNSSSSASDEYLDIIDIVGLLWRAKRWLVLGIIAGTLVALYVGHTTKPAVFVSAMPVTLEVAGGLSVDGSVVKFAEFLSRADVVEGYLSAGGTVINGKIAAKLLPQPSGLTLEVSSKSSDPTGDSALKVARALMMAARRINNQMLNDRANEMDHKGRQVISDIEKNFIKLASAQAMEEAPMRARLFALEARLSQRAGLRPTPGTVVQGASIGDDVLRMLGALDGKISSEERGQVIAQYSELVGAIRAAQAKYDQPIREFSSALSVISAGLIKNITGEAGLYPVVVIDEAIFKANVAARSHERYDNKQVLYGILGFILGGVLGLMGYGLKSFLVSNQSRIRDVMKR